MSPFLLLLGAVLGAGGAGAAPAAAQGVEALGEACADGDPDHLDPCRDAAAAARELHGGLGLAASGGSLLGGSGSTLGHRIEGHPRVALDLAGSLARITYPDVLGDSGAPAPATRQALPGLGAGITVGLFDGFRLLPTVGGVLSVDAVAQARVVPLPAHRGFSSSMAAYGAGVRLGVVRESFNLPGVTFSAAHRRLGSLRFGSVLDGDPARIDLDPRATSLRLVAEKDLVAAGILAGAGWERVKGPVTVRLADGPEGGAEELRSSRPVLFAGGNLTFLVLRVSGEVGWARAHSTPGGSGAARAPKPGSGWFGTLGVRVTY